MVADEFKGKSYSVGGSEIESGLKDVHFLRSEPNLKSDTECYVLKNKRGDVIIAFRGSETPFKEDGSIKDWVWTDMDTMPIKYPLYTGNSGFLGSKQHFVHKGFWKAYNAIRSQLISKVREVLNEGSGNRKIYITGHSLGGALAHHAGQELSTIFDEPVKIFTYGSPRVGNDDFCKALNKNATSVSLFVNNCDPAPYVPP